MFLVAHELYDALPIHQFKYQGDGNWSEMVVKLEGVDYSDQSSSQGLTMDTQINDSKTEDNDIAGKELIFGESAPNTENVLKVLQPSKFFSKEAKKDLKVGDTFEVCPSAVDFTKDLANLIELTGGAALVVDYGEDHAFSSSFRGI
jgi:NADH dehydrogenase [ubiquinone] 1 alpha subcomplex assembly factor 7